MRQETLQKLMDRKHVSAIESAELLGDLVNGAISFRGSDFRGTIKRQHRCLQSELFLLACNILEALAENHDSDFTDARNEYECKKARELVNLMD